MGLAEWLDRLPDANSLTVSRWILHTLFFDGKAIDLACMCIKVWSLHTIGIWKSNLPSTTPGAIPSVPHLFLYNRSLIPLACSSPPSKHRRPNQHNFEVVGKDSFPWVHVDREEPSASQQFLRSRRASLSGSEIEMLSLYSCSFPENCTRDAGHNPCPGPGHRDVVESSTALFTICAGTRAMPWWSGLSLCLK